MSENFTIDYYYMGQGDCILIECPDKRLVMIDCGSTKGLGLANEDLLLNVCKDVREKTKKNHGKIDILILTHRDSDHYNQINQVLVARTIRAEAEEGPKKKIKTSAETIDAIKIDAVYYGSPEDKTIQYALSEFRQNGCGISITDKHFKTTSVNKVFINATEQKMLRYKQQDAFKLSAVETIAITEHKRTLLEDITPKNKKWSVSLIAGHVPEFNAKDPDITNALSLVTLLQIGNAKALFLGDATEATERFLMDTHKELIKDVDFVHIPHHGSLTSSGDDFVKLVKPRGAEITHETYEDKHRLPKQKIMQRWLDVLKTGKADKHKIDYWKEIDEHLYTQTLALWKLKYPAKLVKHGDTCYLQDLPGTFTGYICLNKDWRQHWGLERVDTTSDLWGTGATGAVTWTLPI